MDLESRYKVILIRALQIQLNDCRAKIARYERRMGDGYTPSPDSPSYDSYLEACAMRDALNFYIKRFRADIVAHNLLFYL